MAEQRAGLTPIGKIISFLMIAGLIALGAWLIMRPGGQEPTPGEPASPGPVADTADTPDTPAKQAIPVAASAYKSEIPRLPPAQAYQPRANEPIDIELSEYAGYAGLIVANGGLTASDDSFLNRTYGLRLNITLSEEESWDKLNSGKLAASATTADVLAVYGRQFDVVVPAQIGFSRGADGIVVRSDINRINQLKGKTLATGQFTEAEFFIRYLAQEAGIGINLLPDSRATPAPDKINLVFTEDAFQAGDLFAQELEAGRDWLAGFVGWAPKTTEVADGSGGKAKVLTTNRNLLIVADVLIVNRGFAEAHPDKVKAIVHGLLEGNRMVRDNPDAHLDTIVAAFNTLYKPDDPDRWDRESARDELSRVHLSNLPENQAFFSGSIDAAGSFGGIYAAAQLAYGDMIRNPVDAERFVDGKHLAAIAQAGLFKDQTVAIAPIRTAGGGQSLEVDPLLSKDIRFFFMPNSSELDLNNSENLDNLRDIQQLLQVSPGSRVLLRGHVDNARMEEFRKMGGEAFVRQKAIEAMKLSKDRATEIQRLLIERHQVEPSRIETIGRGWEEPADAVTPTDDDRTREDKSARNRRVEVYWYTLE